MIEKIKSLAQNERWIEILFTFLLLSFPFGSYLLSFSIGFMVMYPYFMLLMVLMFLSVWMPRQPLPKLVLFYIWFLVIFAVYALVYYFFVDEKKYALVDIRSIILMLGTSWVFVATRYFLGFEKWRNILVLACKLILVMLILCAVLEITTGWHLAGEFTKKIIERGLKDMLIYTPVFLWDNPNNFMVYFILIGLMLTILEAESSYKDYQTAAWLIVSLVFAVNTESRISQFLVVVIAFIYLGYRLWRNRKSIRPIGVMYLTFLLVGMVYVVSTHVVFKEIPHAQERVVSKTEPRYPLPAAAYHQYGALLKPEEVSENAITDSLEIARNSMDERIALLQNAIDFTTESYCLGIGPGQYRYRHDQNQVNHNTFGNNGAHFWLLELLSQYGVAITGIYVLLIGWIFIVVLRSFKKSPELAIGLLIGLAALFCTSALPSAFLILDINWIFTIVMVIVAAELILAKKDPGQ